MKFGRLSSTNARECTRGQIRRSTILAIICLVVASFPTKALSSARDRSLARSFLASAQDAWKAGNQASALEKLKLAVEADSNCADAFLLMGLIEFQQGDIASSIQHYKRAIALQPSSYSARYNLALAYLREHRLQDGKVELEQALKIDPHQADAEYDLGLVLLELGNPSAAVVHLKNSRFLNARKPDVSFNIVRAYLEAGNVSKARNEADAAVRQLAGDVQWNAAIGQLFLKNGQPNDAVNYLRRAVVARPEDYVTRRQLAMAYLAARDPQPVLELIESPTTADGHYLRGSAYYLRKSAMIPILGYRIQELAYGGLSTSTSKRLLELARAIEANSAAPIAPDPRIKPGTRLVRQWHGQMHVVNVEENTYEYKGSRYGSLSAVAQLITGTKWSGPRFFGLKRKRNQS